MHFQRTENLVPCLRHSSLLLVHTLKTHNLGNSSEIQQPIKKKKQQPSFNGKMAVFAHSNTARFSI